MSKKKDEYNARMTPGTRVQLSGQFLRNTGQQVGGEGRKVWTVIECPCDSCAEGLFLAVDEEKADLGYWSAEELASMPYLRFRHFHRSNLVIKGTLSVRNT